ncbi:hypothetical protein IHQ11_26670 [Priestia megaterium]|uniref:hypothetical protein n=1 Tax=Priestia megaterium TaxID=1404 RepID=UPI001B3A2244|nr:hypothetical protein [Priestia megaterium]MBQ4870036.1 hypothetical protein [Priestia megaterium]
MNLSWSLTRIKRISFLSIVAIFLSASLFTATSSAAEVNSDDTDSEDGVFLGEYTETGKPGQMGTMDSYRETTTYKVYDQGITKTWSYLSKPYFIKSIARGMKFEESKETSATISASFSGDIPSKSAVNRAFGFSASSTKTVRETTTFSGPPKGYSSRDFYYKKGRHTHKVKTVVTVTGNQGRGVIRKTTHYGYVGKPAIKNYSVDKK